MQTLFINKLTINYEKIPIRVAICIAPIIKTKVFVIKIKEYKFYYKENIKAMQILMVGS